MENWKGRRNNAWKSYKFLRRASRKYTYFFKYKRDKIKGRIKFTYNKKTDRIEGWEGGYADKYYCIKDIASVEGGQ